MDEVAGQSELAFGKGEEEAFARPAKAAMRLRIAAVWGHQGLCAFVSPRWRRTPRTRKKYGVESLVVLGGQLGKTVGCFPVLNEDPVFIQGGKVLSRSRRIRKFLPQLCVCVSRLVTMVCIWCTRSLGRLNFLDLLLRHNALVGGHLGPRKKADEHYSTR